MNKLFQQKKINSYIIIGLTIVFIVLIFSFLAGVLSPYDPLSTDSLNKLQPPGKLHLMGTDDVGRDVLTRAAMGIKVSLSIGISVTLISALTGIAAGIIAAYYPATSKIIMRVVDGIMAFPTIILAITLAGILGAGTKNIVVALSVSYFPTIARVTRNAVLEVLGKEYIESVIALGKSDFYIIFYYIIPNIIFQVSVQITFTFAMAILHESILSFLGVGIKVPIPSLGGMVSEGRNYINIAPWIITFPGLIISFIVLALNMFGDGIREMLEPKKKSRD